MSIGVLWKAGAAQASQPEEHMDHVYWVKPGLLAGRCGPDKVPWDVGALYARGFRTVVTVASEVPVGDLAPYGLHHRREPVLPLPWLTWLGQRRLARRLMPLLEFIHAELAARRPVLVHCHDGDDRTGVVLAGYLVIYAGLVWRSAVACVRDANPRAMKMPGYAGTVRWFRRPSTSDVPGQAVAACGEGGDL